MTKRAAVLFAIAWGWLASPSAGQQRSATPDFRGVDEFWGIHDLLARDLEPNDEQWSALLSTPGYALVERNLGPVVREDLEIAFEPSRAKARDRLRSGMSERAMRVEHLLSAERERPSLAALRDSLAAATPIADAVALAQRYLPPGATALAAPPPVSFALFKDDAFASPHGIVVDLMNAHGGVLVPVLAHEFHHAFVYRLSPGAPADGMPGSLADVLYVMRNEGIADQIDKAYPFKAWTPGLDDYAARYNAEYARAPRTIARLDSLLRTLDDDPWMDSSVTSHAQKLLWSSGHPVGAYIARTILETFGPDSIYPGTRNPAAFLRTFAAAERARGHADPFSPATWRVIDAFEARRWK
jgi:hypothetical protein